MIHMRKTNANTGKRLLVAGGDLRQVTAAAKLAETDSVVMVGFDQFTGWQAGMVPAQPADALPIAVDALILPMPVTQDGVFLYAPFSTTAIALSALLPCVRAGGTVFGGRLTAAERTMIAHAGYTAIDYAAREEFAVRNAVPTAEGAILLALQELPVTLHRLPCLILGAGRVSRALQTRLCGLGASVSVAARRCSDLAWRQVAEGKPHKKSALAYEGVSERVLFIPRRHPPQAWHFFPHSVPPAS